MGSHKLNNHQPESIAQQDEVRKFWDRSVLTRSAWMAQLPRQLARDNPNFRSLWEEGYVAEKQVAITQSAAHSFHLSIGNVKKQTLWQPCPMNTFVKLDASIADAEVATALSRGFREAPTMVKDANRELHDRILFYISNIKAVEDYEKKSNGNFIALVGILFAEENAADAETGTWANNEKQKLIKAGLATASIVCFDNFRLQFDNFNAMCKVGRHDPEPVVATILTDVVRDFGDIIATKLEMKLDAAGATGDLDKTVSVIHILLGKLEGKTLGNARAAAGQSDADFNNAAIASARAAAGRDPIVGGGDRSRERERDDYVPPVWTVGKHDLCDLCTRPDRKHLRKYCPDSATPGVDPRRQAAKDKRDKERTDKKKKKGAARMAGAGTSGDDPAELASDVSDSESDCSECSEQSTYDDEDVVSVQAADLALASLQSTVDRGHRGAARVAHRPPRQSDTVEQSNAQMAALHSMRHSLDSTVPSDLQSLPTPTPEIQSIAWAVGAASAPLHMQAPPSPVLPLPPPPPPSIHSIADDALRGCITPLRREDARRIIGGLDSTSPLLTMQSVARAAELAEVRLSCGPPSKGSTVNRTKAHVLADMRAAVGLDADAVPMGIPMQTGGGVESSESSSSRSPPPSRPTPPPLPPTPVQMEPKCSKGTCLPRPMHMRDRLEHASELWADRFRSTGGRSDCRQPGRGRPAR